MDTDQQVRLNFLEESGEYFEQIETVLLGLTAAENKAQQLDIALRSAHSIKGGAGMMGFTPMAQVAHRLEDFFKILRARQISWDTELETLFLGAVDGLKEIRQRLVQELPVDEAWLANSTEPLFAQLRSRLGDLSDEDEDRLLSEEEGVDVALLMFNSGVEEILNRFEADLEGLAAEALRSSLVTVATQLTDLGLIGELDAFVQLCESVLDPAMSAPAGQLQSLAAEALRTWRRAQSLVQLGRVGNLPTQIIWVETAAETTEPVKVEPVQRDEPAHEGLEAQLGEVDLSELQRLQAEMAQVLMGSSMPSPAFTLPDENEIELDKADLEQAAEASLMDTAPVLMSPASETVLDGQELSQLQDAIAQLNLSALESIAPVSELIPEEPLAAASPVASPVASKPLSPVHLSVQSTTAVQRGATLRIAAEDLQQINTLFGTLILERNALNLRQQQLDGFAGLLQERMRILESFNQRLRQWYDRTSLEGLIRQLPGTEPPQGRRPLPPPLSPLHGTSLPGTTALALGRTSEFDSLEMDQYSDLHLMAQEQMETIVQLQEVAADIQLGLQEIGQVTQQLNSTTRLLQNRMTRTQMRPFSDIAGRFPRLMRDLSVQYGKQVELKVEGETTLVERSALDALVDPLTHLLRNAFDHGLETPDERLAIGKSPMGQITLRAIQRGNQVRILVKDDGRGIDLEKIRDRVRKYDIPEDHIAQMSERQLLSLIFDAGFSTAEAVTELSGRGVGMDVVRANLEQLRGDIQVETKLGQGTTFTLSVPLTLSVLRVLLLEQHKLTFAVPVDAIEEMLVATPEMLGRSPQDLTPTPPDSPSYLRWKDQSIPIVDLADSFCFQGKAEPVSLDGNPSINRPLFVVVRDQARFYAVPMQRLWHEQEVAIRPVTSLMPLPTGFVGATILGDGRVIPLVDLVQLVHAAISRTAPAPPSLLTSPLAATVTSPIKAEPIRELGTSSLGLDPRKTKGASQARQQTILVVDDSVHLRRYLTITLEKAGYRVEQAKDGQEAVDKLLGGLSVEAVICDVEMPRLDGYGVLEEIKQRAEFQSLPITMLTSRSSDKHRKLAMNLGASAYFSKPYNEQELLKALEHLIQKA